MKNIICFLSGIVAGIAMCLTAAYYLPESIRKIGSKKGNRYGKDRRII